MEKDILNKKTSGWTSINKEEKNHIFKLSDD